MTPSALLAAFRAHNWMPALVMMSLLVRTWLTDKSKFPMSLPPNWQPVVVAGAAGFVNAVATAQAGAPPMIVLSTTMAWMASTGFLDGVLAAMWGDTQKAPWWGRAVVMSFDTTRGPPSGPALPAETQMLLKSQVTPSGRPIPGPISNKMTAYMAGIVLMALASLYGCAPANYPSALDVVQYAQAQDACVDTSGTRAEADDCRVAVRAQWCVKWPAAENCPVADAATAPTDGVAHE